MAMASRIDNCQVSDSGLSYSNRGVVDGTSSEPDSFSSLRDNHILSTHWSFEEQKILDQALIKHAAEQNNSELYSKISAELDFKLARDVALRVRWMKVNGGSPQIPTSQSDSLGYDSTGYKFIDGSTGALLEQNEHVLGMLRDNLTNLQLNNLDLFCQTRDNLLKLKHDLERIEGIENRLPPLPQINEKLANTILPRSNIPMILQQQQQKHESIDDPRHSQPSV